MEVMTQISPKYVWLHIYVNKFLYVGKKRWFDVGHSPFTWYLSPLGMKPHLARELDSWDNKSENTKVYVENPSYESFAAVSMGLVQGLVQSQVPVGLNQSEFVEAQEALKVYISYHGHLYSSEGKDVLYCDSPYIVHGK